MSDNHRGIDIVVGIPSFQEADSIGFVVSQVDRGLTEHFGNREALIVNVDNHSPDDTKDAFLSTETRTAKRYITTPEGVRGKGNNLRNLFELCAGLAKPPQAVVVVDADLKSITPEWVRNLAQPILEGFDYALPLYSRHQFDGTITNHLCYPLIYSLFGRDLRQPIGGDFAFSPALARYWLDQEWTDSTRQYGIDIFMTGNAVAGGFSTCEVGLGAKIHKASAPKLGPMFIQVVTTLFDLILRHRGVWSAAPTVRPEPTQRFGMSRLDPPQELRIDIRQMKDQLREEYLPRRHLLEQLLDDYTITRLRSMFDQDYYDLDVLMWTQIVYRMLFAYDTGSEQVRRDVVEALRPLYFTRSVAYDYLTWRYNVKYAEAAVAEQAKAFASQKPYLLGLYLDRK